MVTAAASPHPYPVAIVTFPLLALSHLLVLFLLFHPLMRHFVLMGRNVSLYFLGSDARREMEWPRSPWKILHLRFLPFILVALLRSEMTRVGISLSRVSRCQSIHPRGKK